jgi:hypothetical protein
VGSDGIINAGNSIRVISHDHEGSPGGSSIGVTGGDHENSPRLVVNDHVGILGKDSREIIGIDLLGRY